MCGMRGVSSADARIGTLARPAITPAGWPAVLLRLAYLTVANAFVVLRLLPMSDRDKHSRTERTVRGLPGRLGRKRAAWRRATRSRCQRSTVSGRTTSRILRSTSEGRRCSNAARNERSPGENRTLSPPSWRSSTVI